MPAGRRILSPGRWCGFWTIRIFLLGSGFWLPVGAENAFTSCDLRVLVDQAAELVAWSDADVVAGGRDMGPAVGWLLAEGPVRPVGVVVVDVFAEDVVEVPLAGDED